MSSNDDFQPVEQKSSIKIGSNAKGDPVVDVKVYSGATKDEMDELRAVAVEAYRQTRVDVGFPVAA